MSDREELMKKIAMYDFALVELHLFLDTHPNDRDAMKKVEEYKEKSKKLTDEYQECFGPIRSTSIDANRWAWISNPWPWDRRED